MPLRLHIQTPEADALGTGPGSLVKVRVLGFVLGSAVTGPATFVGSEIGKGNRGWINPPQLSGRE